MKLKILYIAVILIFSSFYLSGQNLRDNKLILKANFSDLLFMGRYTFEGEMPILKNASLLLNLGVHHKDYFYDNREQTFSNPGMFRATPAIFPTKNIFGWNTGLGFRQYLKFKDSISPAVFLEIKGTYRKSKFGKDFDVFVDFGSGGGGTQGHSVNGTQQVYSLYFALGTATLFNKNKYNIDVSVGLTQNFVKLGACRSGCSVPSWDWPPFLNPDGSLPTSSQSQAFADSYYQPKEPFIRFRATIKYTFLKLE